MSDSTFKPCLKGGKPARGYALCFVVRPARKNAKRHVIEYHVSGGEKIGFLGPLGFRPGSPDVPHRWEGRLMTPEEYEHRPEVKAALKLMRENRELLCRTGSWMTFKHRLMKLLGIPETESMAWDVPIEFIYSQKRIAAHGERGWSKKDAFNQVVGSSIKRGLFKIEGAPERSEGGELSYDAEGRLRWGRKAAGILIRRTDTGMFLLVLRSADVMDPGILGIPGGRIETGETEEDAAFSETEEELGLIPDVKIVDRDVYQSGDFTYVTFLADMLGEDAQGWVPTLNWENDAWLWTAKKELEGIEEIHPNVRRVIEKWS